ncbi:MAG: DNA polymerase III subunit alpha [Patescibacteria group bacterium]|nr:DNA polymerase III subunit alpha [Patescibacteria group bacterium]
MSSKFIHLHAHSHYSLLDGLSKIDDLVEIAQKNKMEAIALTDHGNMYGAIEFYKKCREAKIKPIIGLEAYIAFRGRNDREPGVDNKRYHLTLLAKNLQGYKNLMRLVTISNLEGFYYKPRIDKDILRKYNEGLICLSGCPASELSKAIENDDLEKAEEVIKEHIDIFGKENYFLEVHCHPHIENDKKIRNKIIELGKKFDIPTVAGQDAHYPYYEDHEAHHTLLQVNTGLEGKNKGKFEFSDDDFSLIDEKTALKYFKDTPESVYNTKIVADLCENYDLGLGEAHFPNWEIEKGKTADEILREEAYGGFEFRELKKTKEYTDRLDYELEIIKRKGYPTYFLVVGDLLREARERKILTNIRGSVAGSLTTYLLGITKVDPLVYKLPFERFLNPERPSLPDIDMDFADNRRDEIITYAKEKYGEENVAQIGTFGTMMAKGSVRDVARALDYPYSIGDRIASMIPLGSQGMPMTINHAMDLIPELKKAYKTEPDTKKIINLAKKLEGCVRHISVHAAGVVIAPTSLYNYCPIQYDPKGGNIITQYDMYSIEDAGLPKFDFLGIRNLAILAESVKLVKAIHNIKIDIDKIPLDDKKTFEMLTRGETMGLFQLNGSGMTRYLKELKPNTIHDINAMVALYRPGPMESIPEYIKRKHNHSKIKYLDPRLKDILDQSFGVITYQDDVMMIAIKLAGYSWLEADKLRKAMGKKIPAVMEAEKNKLLEGFVKKEMTEEKAKKFWELIEPFAAYGFNKAHAASYGLVAYQTAYMKANYPIEYMSAILTAESGDIKKVSEIVKECQKMGIEVLPPDIKESFGGFTVISPKEIRFGLYTIKNLGSDISNAIIEERKKKGQFKTLDEFFQRINHKNLNKKSVEALAKSGAMDTLAERNEIINNMETLLNYNKETNKVLNQESLFGGIGGIEIKLNLKKTTRAKQEEKLAWEKDLLGLYISGHPLEKYQKKIDKFGTVIKKIKKEVKPGSSITVAAIIDSVKVIITKNGDRMAFVKISDHTEEIEAVIFPKLFMKVKDILEENTIIALNCKVNDRNNEKSLIINNLKAL